MAINESIESILSQYANIGTVGFVFSLFIVIILISILLFAAWIWMIVDCAKRKKFKHGDRVLWILLLVLTGIIGMILYFFMEMHER